MPDLLVERDDHVAIVTLNRPDRLNAISIPMLQAFSETLTELDTDRNVRVIVITGAGRGFCSGLDMKDVAAGTGIGSDGGGGIGRFDLRSAPPLVLHQTDKPTLCALNGPAAGYGMDLALGCDIRIASDTAKLGAVFTKRAIVPESGGTWLLPRLVGWEKACEIVFRGKILSAQEALELGLVSRNAPMAVQASKRMMRMGLDETFEANVHHVFLQLLPLMGSKDFREGVKAFLERREPEFEGR
jgi:enoyl-CoA hydratase/carnithine racemase